MINFNEFVLRNTKYQISVAKIIITTTIIQHKVVSKHIIYELGR